MAAKSNNREDAGKRAFSARPIVLAGAALAIAGLAYGGVSAYRSRAIAASGECCRLGGSGECCRGGATVGGVTLDPALFVGPVRDAYKVAREHPDLLAQMHCYCGCDRVLGHHNLLDCYRDRHGSTCEICVGEAVEANKLLKQGMPIDQIRDALRARYARRW